MRFQLDGDNDSACWQSEKKPADFLTLGRKKRIEMVEDNNFYYWVENWNDNFFDIIFNYRDEDVWNVIANK